MKRVLLFVLLFVFCSTAQAGMFDQIKGVTDTLQKATTPAKKTVPRTPAEPTAAPDAPGRASSPAAAADSKADQKLRGDFYNAYWLKYRDLVELYMPLYDKPDLFLVYGDTEKLAKVKAAFQDIHSGCTTKFQGVTDDPRRGRSEPIYRWSVWCQMAAQGDELVKRAVTNKVAYLVSSITESYEKQSKNLAASNGRLKDWDQNYYVDPEGTKAGIVKQMSADLKVAGLEKPPDEAFAKTDQALAKLLGEIKEEVKNWKCEPDGTPASDSFVSQQYTAAFKGAKVIRNYKKYRDWKVTLNYRGVPTHRAMKGMIVFKLPNETWCRSQEYDIIQDYQGRGYGKNYFEHSPRDGWTTMCTCP